jgi:hypothetical protein
MTLQRVTANGDSSGGWSFKPKQPIEMKAGRVVLIALSDFRDESGTPWPDYKRSWGCRLPVSVVVFTGDDERSINAEGLPALPSSMPRDLEDNCRERVDQVENRERLDPHSRASPSAPIGSGVRAVSTVLADPPTATDSSRTPR